MPAWTDIQPPRSATAATEAAFLFDLDGVLVDSAEMVEAGWLRFAAEHGFKISKQEIRTRLFGRRTVDILQDRFGMSAERARELIEAGIDDQSAALAAGTPLPEVPGAADFVRRARTQGIRCAVVTSTSPSNARLALDRIGLSGEVDGVIDASVTSAGKPDPDPYLQALKALAADPGRSVAFEDTQPGIRAARRAGVKVVALSTSQPKGQLEQADLIIPDFRRQDPVQLLLSLVGRPRPGE